MPVRRNPAKRAPTAQEQRAFSSGFGRTFSKKKKTTTKRAKRTKRHAPPAPKVSKAAEAKRRSKREAAYRRARAAGYPKDKAARRAMHVQPFLKTQKGRTFKGLAAYTGKKTAKELPKQYAKKTVSVTRKVTKKVPAKRRVRVAYGKYKRIKATEPRTGQKKRSYLYKTKTGRRRKIPSYAIGGAPSAKAWKDSKYDKARSRIKKRRSAAARKVERRGGPFTPNRRKAMSKSTKRSRAAKKGWATRRAKAAKRRRAAKKSARRSYRRNTTTSRKRRTSAKRATPNRRRTTRRRVRKNAPRRRATTRRRKSSTALARNPRRRTTRRRATLRANRSTTGKDPKRVRAGKKAARTRKRRQAAGVRRGKGRAGTYLKRGKIYYKGRKPRRLRGVHARKLPKARIYITNRRRKTTTRRRRSYRRNQFMASVKAAATSALFVTSGFVAHKALTYGLYDKLIMPQLQKSGAATTNQAVKTALPIVAGALTAALGVFITSKVVSRQRTVELGAGMFTSWLHTVVVKVLDMSDATRPALPFVSGYDTASTAAAIGRFRRRRGVRGLGADPARSILPQYTPAMGQRPGGIRQAVALAGRRGTGEYFQTSGLGEYFASGVQGVGQYEPAGPMVTQAAAGLGQQIDNGIMPDQADAALTLAESQAGLGKKPMGEYYSARPDQSGSGYSEYRVPTQSQWVPNGPLWAGTELAQNKQATSDIPAGVLESASGNGIF